MLIVQRLKTLATLLQENTQKSNEATLPDMKKYYIPLKVFSGEIGIERAFLPVLTGINQPAMAQHRMHRNNTTLSKQTCRLQTLKTRNFSLKVTPQLRLSHVD